MAISDTPLGDDAHSKSSRARGRPCRGVGVQINHEILQAARDLFLNLGYERTSMAMVTRAAGVSKTTLYSRYATKAELFLASLNFTVEVLNPQTLEPSQDRALDVIAGLKAFGREAIRTSLDPLWTNYERLIYAEGPRFPELTFATADQVDDGIEKVKNFVVACVEREGKAIVNPYRVARTYVMALRGYYAAALLTGKFPDDEQIGTFVDELVDLLAAARPNW